MMTDLPIPVLWSFVTMVTMELVRAMAILCPILALMVLGLAITLRSGVANVGTGQGLRQLAGNLTQTLVALGACLVGLMVLQELVGFRLGLLG